MPDLPGQPRSLWMDTTPDLGLAPLEGDIRAEVAVVGAGITGLTTAALVAAEGVDVVVLEAGVLGGGVTGHTTAKVTALHGLVYSELRRKFGPARTRAYAQANQAAIAAIGARIERDGIQCGWRRRAAYTYVDSAGERAKIDDEVAAAREAGLEATLVEDCPLPWPVAAAVRLLDQAEFHPRAYLLGLARGLAGDGGRIFEHSPVLSASLTGRPELRTQRGRVSADHVVIATLMPILDRGLFFTRLTAKRSYCLAARTRGALPEGMFISADGSTRSIRAQAPVPPVGEGSSGPSQELLIVGGAGHTVGERTATGASYLELERFAREHFDVAEVTHRWSSQDLTPADGLPYVGALTPLSKRIITATGFRKWGLTNGTAAAAILSDRLLGRENEWASAFDSNRFTPRQAAAGVLSEIGKDARHFLGDRLRRPRGARAQDLVPGQGDLVTIDGRLVAAYRDQAGSLHAVSALCTHVGCRVAFNEAERSWDCPCHGSRFDVDGNVLQGPAVRALAPRTASSPGAQR